MTRQRGPMGGRKITREEALRGLGDPKTWAANKEKVEREFKKKPEVWMVDCFDSFSSEWYGNRKFTTKEAAEAHARKRREEIEKNQPFAQAGSIQDRVYITDPQGNQTLFR